MKGFAVRSGDIIISCAGTIGELFILPDGCEAGIINQALMRVRINSERIIPNFFCYYFSEIIKGDVINQANGTAIKNIPPFKVLKTMEIRLPSIEEQNEIVRLIDSYLYKDNQIIESAKNVITGIETMKKSILAKAFRGELGTNDPSEEPVAL